MAIIAKQKAENSIILRYFKKPEQMPASKLLLRIPHNY